MIVRVRVPLRIELAGGGTDCVPWSVEKGSHVVSVAISKFASASVYTRNDTKEGDNGVIIDAWDLDVHNHRLVSTKAVTEDEVASFFKTLRGGPASRFEVVQAKKGEEKLDFVKAAMNLLGLTPEDKFYLYFNADSPIGTGLDTSSATVLSIFAALHEWILRTRSEHSCIVEQMMLDNEHERYRKEYAYAQIAWEIERKVLGIPGGWQGFVSGAFGGFNSVRAPPGKEWPFPGAEHQQWWPEPAVLNELEECSLLAFIGRRERSGQIEALQAGMKTEHLAKAMAKAAEMTEALRKGDLRAFGLQVHDAWEAKFTAANSLVNDRLIGIYRQALSNGAIGGCLSGAGSGGFLFLSCEPQLRRKTMRILEREKAPVWPFTFEERGLQVWTVPE